jgi:RNA polymerase sigma-70 factor (ECF subfamily)
VTDEWRRKKAIPMSTLSSENEDGETEFDVADEKEEILPKAEYDRIVRLFAELEDTDSQVLQMRFVEDLPIKDIARILGERENTVAVRINRALAKLKKIST